MAMLAQLTTVLTVGSLLAVFDRYAISPRQPSPSGDG
jgi:hypothetical protein